VPLQADTADPPPWEVEELSDRLIDHHNNGRVHQRIGLITPAGRRPGRHIGIIAVRQDGMHRAREQRKIAA
jgi:hypothetical protein